MYMKLTSSGKVEPTVMAILTGWFSFLVLVGGMEVEGRLVLESISRFVDFVVLRDK